MVCDFCSSRNILYSYPALNFLFDIEMGSKGAWLACIECSRLIERADLEGLVNRTFGIFQEAYNGNLSMEAKDVIRELHSQFWMHKVGERIEIQGTT